jgi:hypothetical protein
MTPRRFTPLRSGSPDHGLPASCFNDPISARPWAWRRQVNRWKATGWVPFHATQQSAWRFKDMSDLLVAHRCVPVQTGPCQVSLVPSVSPLARRSA